MSSPNSIFLLASKIDFYSNHNWQTQGYLPRRNECQISTFTKACLWLATIPIAGVIGVNSVQAQSIVPATDGTNTIVTPQDNRFDITGGQTSGDGANLFHTFTEFGLTEGQIANFLSRPDILNILARINGGNPSFINGLIQVTGGNSNLFLMNQAGIIFGANASLNVPGAFTATTANGIGFGANWFNAIGTNNYANLVGKPSAFAFTMNQPGNILNFGNLGVGIGQDLNLLAGTIVNTGQLSAPEGNITITAVPGESLVRLSQPGYLLSLEVNPIANNSNLPNNWNLPIASLPQMLTGGSVGSATGVTVNQDGSVKLTGSGITIPQDGNTNIASGNINVSGEKGGQINILGGKVGIIDGNINADGSQGGGTILIGGEREGKGTIPNAQNTFISKDSTISADAIDLGKGGRIIIFADETARVYGNILARGGRLGGDGGFVETSGKQNLEITTTPQIQAPAGLGGEWLIDPYNIEIVAGNTTNGKINNSNPFESTDTSAKLGVDLVVNALKGGSSVTITTGSGGLAEDGTITLSAELDYNGKGNNTLTLKAISNININNNITDSSPGGDLLDLIFQSGGTIKVTNASINTNGGKINFTGTGANGDGGEFSEPGNIGIIIDNSTINSGTGSIAFNATGGNGDVDEGGAGILLKNSSSIISSSGEITLTGKGGNGAGADDDGAGISIANSNITSNTGIITLTGTEGTGGTTNDAIDISGISSISTTNNILLQPGDPAQAINIGVIGVTAGLDLSQIEITALKGNIIIGGKDSTGQIAIAPTGISFNDPVTLQSPTGTLLVNGDIQTNNNTLTLKVETTIINADIITGGEDFIINNPTKEVTLLGNGSIQTGGGTIDFTGTDINTGIVTLNASNAIGTGGNVNLNATNKITVGANIDASGTPGGKITFTGNEINLNAGTDSVKSKNGQVLLQPAATDGNLTVASGGNLDTFAEGFSQIIFGKADGVGNVIIDASGVAFSDPVKFQTGGTIAVDGELKGVDNASFSFNGKTDLSANITANQGITFNDAVTLKNDVTLDTSAGNGLIFFSKTLNSSNGENLTLNSGNGVISFSGTVGDTQSPGKIIANSGGTTNFNNNINAASIVTNAGGTTSINGNITTSGDQNYGDAVTLNKDVTLSSSGGKISFDNNIDNTFTSLPGAEKSLTAIASGDIIFNGTIGNNTPLGNVTANSGSTTRFNTVKSVSLTTDANGTTELNGNIITSGDQTYNDPVQLNNDINLNSSGGNISFNNSIDGKNAGQEDLSITTAIGNIGFKGAVGNTIKLGNLNIDNAGTLNITDTADINLEGAFDQTGKGAVSTAGDIITSDDNITFNSAVTLTGNVKFNPGKANISFNSTLNANNNPLNLTAGEINFGDKVTGSSTLVLEPGTASQNIELGGNGDGDTNALDLTAAELANIQNGFTSITIGREDGSGTITFASPITFQDPVTIQSPTGGGSIAFSGGTIAGEDNASISLITNQTITVGGITAPAGISIKSNSGSIDSSAGNLDASNASGKGGDITLKAAKDIVASTVNSSGAFGGKIDVNSSDGSVSGGFNASASGGAGGEIIIKAPVKITATGINSTGNSGTGNITLTSSEINFSGAANSVKGNGIIQLQPFTENQNLNIAATDFTAFADGFTSIIIGKDKGSGIITISNPFTFSDPTIIQSPSGTIVVSGTIKGIDNASLTIIGNTNLNGDLTTADRDITIKGNTTLGNNVTVSTGANAGGDIQFNGTINGNQDLTLEAGTGNIAIDNAIGNNNRIGNLSINSATNITTKDITAASITQKLASGNTNFGALNTNTLTGINLNGNNFSLNGAIATTNSGAFTINNSGQINIADAADMNLDGVFNQTGKGAIFTSGDIATNNKDIRFTSPVTLTGNVTFNPGTATIAFGSSLAAGNNPLTLTAGEIDFGGPVSGNNTLVLQPATANRNVVIGTFNSSDWNLTSAEIALLQNGFSSITIGRSDSIGLLTVGNITFQDSVLIRSGAGTIAQNGPIAGVDNASITLDSLITTLNSDITTTGGNITIGRNVSLAKDVNISTSKGDINFTGPIEGSQQLTLTASGNVIFNAAVGAQIPLSNLNIISAANALVAGGINTTNALQFNMPVLLTADSIFSTGAGKDITFNSLVAATKANNFILNPNTGNVTFNSGIINVGDISIVNANNFTAADNIQAGSLLYSAGKGNINPIGNVITNGNKGVDLRTNGIITTNNIITNGSNITIISNNNPIATATLDASSTTKIGGNVFVSSPTAAVTTNDLNARGVEAGGNVTVISGDRINTGNIDVSAAIGKGGSVLLDPPNDIQVGSINAQGGTNGTGGNVDITTARYFRAIGAFSDRNNINASISTTGGTGGGSIIIRHAGGDLNTPFVVGNSTTPNGTLGALTSGEFTISPIQSFPGLYTLGNIQIITSTPLPPPEIITPPPVVIPPEIITPPPVVIPPEIITPPPVVIPPEIITPSEGVTPIDSLSPPLSLILSTEVNSLRQLPPTQTLPRRNPLNLILEPLPQLPSLTQLSILRGLVPESTYLIASPSLPSDYCQTSPNISTVGMAKQGVKCLTTASAASSIDVQLVAVDDSAVNFGIPQNRTPISRPISSSTPESSGQFFIGINIGLDLGDFSELLTNPTFGLTNIPSNATFLYRPPVVVEPTFTDNPGTGTAAFIYQPPVVVEPTFTDNSTPGIAYSVSQSPIVAEGSFTNSPNVTPQPSIPTNPNVPETPETQSSTTVSTNVAETPGSINSPTNTSLNSSEVAIQPFASSAQVNASNTSTTSTNNASQSSTSSTQTNSNTPSRQAGTSTGQNTQISSTSATRGERGQPTTSSQVSTSSPANQTTSSGTSTVRQNSNSSPTSSTTQTNQNTTASSQPTARTTQSSPTVRQTDPNTMKIAQRAQECEQQVDYLRRMKAGQRSQSNYEKLIECYVQNLEIARKFKNQQWEQYALNNLAVTYFVVGDYAKSIELHQEHLELARKMENRMGEALALSGIGAAYAALGNYKKAIEFYSQSLAITESIPAPQWEGPTLRNLGNAYLAQKNYEKAIEYQEKSLAFSRQNKDRYGEAQALGNLGNIYSALSEFQKAIEYHEQSLVISREIGDRLQEAQGLLNLGTTYSAEGNYSKALEYHQQSLTIVQEIRARLGEGIALTNLGDALFHLRQLIESERRLYEGVEVWETLRSGLGNDDESKVSIYEIQSNTYRNLQEVLSDQSKIDSALEISEKGRARAYSDLLARRLGDSSNQPSSIEPPNIEQIKAIAKKQNATLVEYSITYSNFDVEGKRKAKESELFIWVIKPTGEVAFRRIDLKFLWQQQNTSLASLVSTTREAIGLRGDPLTSATPAEPIDPNDQEQQLKLLHKLLIKPIADLLPNNPEDHVIFIPQESLFLVPFAALQDESGKYLIEQHTILTAPAIQVLNLTDKQRQRVSGSGALVVGNPTMPRLPGKGGVPGEQLESLPGAEKEAIEIATLLNTQAITGDRATKLSILQELPKARIIHLATHGLLDSFRDSDVPGAIALAPSGKDDGFLTSSDILNLKLNAELVVLSACNTGKGKITGDGVIGLSRALVAAGVPSVVVSLWAVPDAPTAELMTEFYKQLQQNPDKAQALRQAMLATLKNNPDPKNWAAFTLIGEAE